MSKLRRLLPVAVALLLAFLLTSCFGTSRTPSFGKRHKPVTGGPPPVLKVATRDELVAAIARNYDAIQSFTGTSVTLTASSGGVYVGRIVDYPGIPAQILFRKPDDIRIHATLPIVGALAFDMASNETSFRFYYARGNEFIEGLNDAPATSANKMENLRPKAFLSSMLIRPWDRATESVMLKDDTDEDDALYRLEFNLKGLDGNAIPGREIWFDRLDNLNIVRQKVYDDLGNIVSDTSYSEWKPFTGVPFPAHIDISRPKDGYRVAIEITAMDMNKELTNAQFTLPQPEGSTLKEIK
ncbi:MAG TPA: hypothetical protein VGL53_19415 [Bryobacteraceae bacterium]|jgi:outer membrane lipoprotein-sorting protein